MDLDIFQRLNTERGITVLLITHEQDIAEYGTRIIVFRDGKIVDDKPNAVRRMAADELAALPAEEEGDDEADPPASPPGGPSTFDKIDLDNDRSPVSSRK